VRDIVMDGMKILNSSYGKEIVIGGRSGLGKVHGIGHEFVKQYC